MPLYSMTTELIKARIKELEIFRDELIAKLNQVEGAIHETAMWGAKLEKDMEKVNG